MPTWQLPILGIAGLVLVMIGAIRLVAWMGKRPYRRMYGALLIVPVLSFTSSFVRSMIVFTGITHPGEFIGLTKIGCSGWPSCTRSRLSFR